MDEKDKITNKDEANEKDDFDTFFDAPSSDQRKPVTSFAELKRPRQYPISATTPEAGEDEPSDAELFEQNPLPEPLDNVSGSDCPEVELVTGPKPLEQAQRYGPFQIIEILPVRENVLGRPQKSVRALLLGAKPSTWLISAFDEQIEVLDQVQVGSTYNFRGIVKRKLGTFNNERRVSCFLNIA